MSKWLILLLHALDLWFQTRRKLHIIASSVSASSKAGQVEHSQILESFFDVTGELFEAKNDPPDWIKKVVAAGIVEKGYVRPRDLQVWAERTSLLSKVLTVSWGDFEIVYKLWHTSYSSCKDTMEGRSRAVGKGNRCKYKEQATRFSNGYKLLCLVWGYGLFHGCEHNPLSDPLPWWGQEVSL